nr:zinc finger protein 665-like [Penaeus vannamei]
MRTENRRRKVKGFVRGIDVGNERELEGNQAASNCEEPGRALWEMNNVRLSSSYEMAVGRGATGGEKTTPSVAKLRQCPYCSYSTTVTTNLKNHLCTHTKEKPYACDRCSYTHLEEPEHETGFCGLPCSFRGSERIRTTCKYFSSYAGLDNEKKKYSVPSRHTPGQVLSISSRIHQCPYCSYASNVTTNLRTHMRTHTKEKPFYCQYCPYRSTTKDHLVKYSYSYWEMPFACPHCPHRSHRKET